MPTILNKPKSIMKIQEAKKFVTTLRIGAFILMFVASLFFACSALKSIYFALQSDISPFFAVSNAIQQAVYFIYERTQSMSLVWNSAPVLNPKQLNSPGNFGFLFIVCCGAIGRVMWDSAANLSSRIAKTLQRVEEIGWERSLMGPSGHSGTKPDVLQINIELEQQDKWYQRPAGMVLLGIAIGVLCQWANLRLGLIG